MTKPKIIRRNTKMDTYMVVFRPNPHPGLEDIVEQFINDDIAYAITTYGWKYKPAQNIYISCPYTTVNLAQFHEDGDIDLDGIVLFENLFDIVVIKVKHKYPYISLTLMLDKILIELNNIAESKQ